VHTSPGALAIPVAGLAALRGGVAWAAGQSDLQQTNALVWIMIAISAAGAIVTFAFLVYSLWKFRDPKVKDRRYG